jgi:hypothetical protein
LADALFEVRALGRQPADFIPTIKWLSSHQRRAYGFGNSDERAVTNVVFVLDCSASMSGSFRPENLGAR